MYNDDSLDLQLQLQRNDRFNKYTDCIDLTSLPFLKLKKFVSRNYVENSSIASKLNFKIGMTLGQVKKMRQYHCITIY
jgi:hypothetical protein